MKNCLKVTPGGAGYVIRCITCKEQQINAVYHGETGRTLYSRLTEHMTGHQKKQEGNPLHKHDQTEHDGDKATSSYGPMGFFQDLLTRQVNKGVWINQSIAEGAQCTIMSPHAKFRQGFVPRIEIIRRMVK